MNTTTNKMATKTKTFKNSWDVKCLGCGVEYVDHRRRVGKCLHCQSVAIIVTRTAVRL